MKAFYLFLTALIITTSSYSQPLKKYVISTSGCSVYLFCNPGEFETTYSEDSSMLYTGVCKAADSLAYGVICVQLKQKVDDIEVAENLVVSYLDYLKKAFDIVSSVGYGKGNTLNGDNNTRGVVDYWKDKTGDEWKVKAWTNGKFIAVLYVYASGALNETEKINVFLDSFRFRGVNGQ